MQTQAGASTKHPLRAASDQQQQRAERQGDDTIHKHGSTVMLTSMPPIQGSMPVTLVMPNVMRCPHVEQLSTEHSIAPSGRRSTSQNERTNARDSREEPASNKAGWAASGVMRARTRRGVRAQEQRSTRSQHKMRRSKLIWCGLTGKRRRPTWRPA